MNIIRPRSFIYELISYMVLVLVMLFIARVHLLDEVIIHKVQGLWIWGFYALFATIIAVRAVRKGMNGIPAAFWFGFFSGAFVWTIFIITEAKSERIPVHIYDIVFVVGVGLVTGVLASLWSLIITIILKAKYKL